MESAPKISVIIPVYNTEKYLKQCLDSVLNQTLTNIEIICVDDGSTDGSFDLLQECAAQDARIRVVKNEEKGVAHARNRGIALAGGTYIAFMDSDDFYPNPNTLQHMYSAAKENNALICGGSLIAFRQGELISDPKKLLDGYTFFQNGYIDFKDYQFDYGYWRFIYETKFLRGNQISFPNYLRFQDPPFFLKAMTAAGKFYALKEATYVYRESYKEIGWSEQKAIDLFKGLQDCLNLARIHDLRKLYASIAARIQSGWATQMALGETMKYGAVRKEALTALQSVDHKILDSENIVFKLSPVYELMSKGIYEIRKEDLLKLANSRTTEEAKAKIIEKYAFKQKLDNARAGARSACLVDNRTSNTPPHRCQSLFPCGMLRLFYANAWRA